MTDLIDALSTIACETEEAKKKVHTELEKARLDGRLETIEMIVEKLGKERIKERR